MPTACMIGNNPEFAKIVAFGSAIVGKQSPDLRVAVDKARRLPRRHDAVEFAASRASRSASHRSRETSGNPSGRLSGNLSRRPGIVETRLHPADVLWPNAELVLQDSRGTTTPRTSDIPARRSACRADRPAPRCRGRCEYTPPNAGTFATEKRGSPRRGIVPRDSAIRYGLKPISATSNSPWKKARSKQFLDRHRQVIDVAAFNAHASVDKRAYPIVVPRRNRNRQTAHDVFIA